MRKIIADAKAFGLSNDQTVNIKLLDRIGQPLSTTYKNQLISFNKTITITDGILEVELYENDLIPVNSFYEIEITGVKFRFQLNQDTDNLAHDLTSLLQLGSNDGVAYLNNDKLVFEDDFIKKVELKLTNQEPYFTENQERVFNFFVFYADYVYGTERTIDLEKELDEYLGSL